jgi:hypothetical protein
MTLSVCEIFLDGQGRGEGPRTGGAAGVTGAISATDALKLARRNGFKLGVDGDDIAFEVPDYPIAYPIIDILRQQKTEIVDLLRDERRAVVRWIADNFRSSPIGQCALCGDSKREDDPFVLVFVGEDRADLHASCHPAWPAEQEAEARVALGIETSVGIRPGYDASSTEARAK